MQKACAGLAGKPYYMDCWLKASSVPWHSNILIDVWFRQDMRLVRQFITTRSTHRACAAKGQYETFQLFWKLSAVDASDAAAASYLVTVRADATEAPPKATAATKRLKNLFITVSFLVNNKWCFAKKITSALVTKVLRHSG